MLGMRDKVAAVVPAVVAAAALVITISAIAEIAAAPTADPNVSSSTWTPATAIAAAVFGPTAFHGDFAPLPILFGWFAILAASILFGLLWAAFVAYCLGRRPHPLAAAILGAACGLATEILLLNLLCNWRQPENGIYHSLPSWGWWVALGAWGITLGLALAAKGKKLNPSQAERKPPPTGANDGAASPGTPVQGRGVVLAGHSPSAEGHPPSPRERPR